MGRNTTRQKLLAALEGSREPVTAVPTVRHLAAQTGMPESTVRYHMNLLTAQGLVVFREDLGALIWSTEPTPALECGDAPTSGTSPRQASQTGDLLGMLAACLEQVALAQGVDPRTLWDEDHGDLQKPVPPPGEDCGG